MKTTISKRDLRWVFFACITSGVLFAFAGCPGLSLRAQECDGPSSTGGVVLKDIEPDGDPSDWAEVLASPAQTTVDGDGSSMASDDCATLSTDLDCPVGQAGRDLNTFAWTYNSTHLFLFQSRYGSVSNKQTFFFFMDADLDQHMGLGDYVLKVEHQGSNRILDFRLYGYWPLDGATPAPMVCENVLHCGDPANLGYADGYDIPGAYVEISGCSLCSGSTGAYGFNAASGGPLDGEGFEVAVPWADMGLPGPRPIFFHVTGTNQSGQYIDNCGGPDDRIGTFGIHGLQIAPVGTATIGVPTSATQVAYDHLVTNTGLFSETADLSVTSSFGFRVDVYSDPDGGPQEFMGTDLNGDGSFDSINPAFDSDLDGFPDTGPLDPGETFALEVRVTIPVGTTPRVEETAVKADASSTEAVVCVTDTTTIGDVQIDPDHTKSGTPGTAVPFCHTVQHFFTSDTLRLSGISPLGWSLSFYADTDGSGVADPDEWMATDTNGDGDFSDGGDDVNPAYDTGGDGYPDTGVLASETEFPLIVTATIPLVTPYGTAELVEVTARASGIHGYLSDSATDTLEVQRALTLEPDQQVYGASGQALYFPHVVANSSGSSDSANLSQTVLDNGVAVAWTVRYWTDPECDGSGSALIESSPPSVGPVAAYGGESCMVAELQIPPDPHGDLDGHTVQLTITATSVTSPTAADTAVDVALLSTLVSCRDFACTQPETSFSFCDTLYAHGYNWDPGDQYTLRFIDQAGTDVSGARSVLVNGLGQFVVGYTPVAGDVPGSWHIRVYEGASLVKEIAVTVSALAPVISGPAAACAREAIILEAPEGYAGYLWSPSGQTSRSISVASASTTSYAVAVTDASGCQGTSAPHTVTVTSCKNLLRNAVVTQLNPQCPCSSSIFSGGTPTLNPGPDDEQFDFVSGANFPHDATDLSSACPLIFYELENDAGSSLRVSKSGGKIVITY